MDFESLLLVPTLEAVGAWNRMSLDTLVWMAGSFSKALPLFVLVLIVTSIFRRWLAPSARHALWSLVLIRLMLPASVASPVSLQHIFSLANVSKLTRQNSLPDWLMFVSGQQESTIDSSLTSDNNTAVSPKPSLLRRLRPGLKVSMKMLLITGSTLMAIATVFAFWHAFGWARYSRPCTDPESRDQLKEAQRQFGIGATIRLRTALQIGSAATFDWLWPVILVPEKMDTLPKTQQTHLIWHEMARIKRHDSAKSLLLSVVRILHWWNPIFWWTQWQWKLERELACDRLVVQRLDEQHILEYGQTLTHYLENPSKHPKPIIDPPGFVSFCDSNKNLARRIQVLSHDPGPDNRFKSCFAWFTFLILGVTGLTDAARVPLQDSPIELPPGTTWHDSQTEEKPSEELETRTYEISQCLNRLRDTQWGSVSECHYPLEWMMKDLSSELQFAVDGLLRPVDLVRSSASTDQPLIGSNGSSCQIVDQQMIVRATASQHDQIARLISNWTDNGRSQITIEVRTIVTAVELGQLFPQTGGQIYNSTSISDEMSPRISKQFNAPFTKTSNQLLESPLPVFVAALLPDALKYCISQIQGDQRSNMLFAPKVTMFDASTASVGVGNNRPFVTGFLTTHSGLEPKIVTCQDGIQFQTMAQAVSDTFYLNVACKISSILDVRTRKFRSETGEFQLQVPEHQESVFQSTVILNDGHTLVLVPLERDPQGLLTLLLITPRIIRE